MGFLNWLDGGKSTGTAASTSGSRWGAWSNGTPLDARTAARAGGKAKENYVKLSLCDGRFGPTAFSPRHGGGTDDAPKSHGWFW